MTLPEGTSQDFYCLCKIFSFMHLIWNHHKFCQLFAVTKRCDWSWFWRKIAINYRQNCSEIHDCYAINSSILISRFKKSRFLHPLRALQTQNAIRNRQQIVLKDKCLSAFVWHHLKSCVKDEIKHPNSDADNHITAIF